MVGINQVGEVARVELAAYLLLSSYPQQWLKLTCMHIEPIRTSLTTFVTHCLDN